MEDRDLISLTSGAYPVDWRHVRALYSQFARIVNDKAHLNTPSEDLISGLAEWISRTFAHYEGIEDRFVTDLAALMTDVEGWAVDGFDAFHWLYKDRRLARLPAYADSSSSRRPTPFEAAIETTRRIIDVNHARKVLVDLPTSAVLGGSLSYGRFFNTRGASDRPGPSDVDLLIIVPDYAALVDVGSSLRSLRGVKAKSVDSFVSRIPLFMELRRSFGERVCFGHKLRMWEDDRDPLLEPFHIPGFYLLNLHVLSLEDFHFLILRDLAVLENDGHGHLLRELHEFREDKAAAEETQRAFDGSQVAVPIEQNEVGGGFVARMRVCHIEGDRFFPGTHLNLILPQFEVRWEATSLLIRLSLLGLRWKLLERLIEERRQRTHEHQVLSAAHTRAAHFAPHVRRRVDRE